MTVTVRIDATSSRELGMGAAVLSAGGGSFPYLEHLALVELFQRYPAVELIPASHLADDARIALVAMVGAPLPMFERFADPQHFARPVAVLEKHLKVKFDAIMGYEIGSMNGLIPVMVAALTGLPLIDADTVGRSFPEIQMSSFAINGVSLAPLAISDIRDNDLLIQSTADGAWMERLLRPIATACGSIIAIAGSHSGAQIRMHAYHGTYSRAMALGSSILLAQAARENPVDALLRNEHGCEVLRGKLVDVERRTDDGFVRGRAVVKEPHSRDQGVVSFQNEYTVVEHGGKRLAMVPDLIAVFDYERGEPLGTEALRYGQHVSVVRIPPLASHITAKALAAIGPRCFGYDFDYEDLKGEAQS